MTALMEPLTFESLPVDDTQFFARALDSFRRTTGSSLFFYELPPDDRMLVLKMAQKLKVLAQSGEDQ